MNSDRLTVKPENGASNGSVSALSKGRAFITNHVDLLPDLDPRSAEARRFRDITLSLISDRGGLDVISEADIQFARCAAATCVQREILESEMLAGAAAGGDDWQEKIERYSKIVNIMNRTLLSLGTNRVPRDVTPDLGRIIAGN